MKKIISCLLAVLMLATTVLGNFSIAVFAEETEYDLTEYKLKSHEVGWGSLGINQGLDGGKIEIKNAEGKKITYEKGLVAHASSELTYDVTGKYITRVTATCGVEIASNNNSVDGATVVFKILADGKTVYESGIIKNQTGSIDIDVKIPGGTKTLTLVTTGGSDGITGDHSAWANPKMYSDPSIKDDFSGMTLTCPETVIVAGETIATTLEAVTNAGDPITPESVTYKSGNTKVLTVSDTGVITGVGAGTTTVTCELKFKGETYTDTVKLTVLSKDSSEKTWSVASPDGTLKIVLKRDKRGKLSYQVADENGVALPGGTIGVLTDLCDFTEALVYVKESKVTERNETYKAISGKRSEVKDHHKEQTITFEKEDFYFDVILRAYDDGFAYRFALRSKDGSEVTLVVNEETSTYTLAGGSKIYAEVITKDEMENRFCYETSYSGQKVENTNGKYLALPLLYTADDDNYVLLSESDLYTDSYSGIATKGVGNNTLKVVFGPVEGPSVVTTGFTSPWRLGIVGKLGDIVESDMVEKLVERTDADYSWVEPGVTAWMWLSEGYHGQYNFQRILEYVDLAAEFNWKYIILDEGWQPGAPAGSGKAYEGYYQWFPALIQYAANKGVGILVWVKYIDLNTTERLDILNEWAEMGIKGIKADFFDNENQATLTQMKAIYERCAELKMVVNCHGANKPTGERISYPNILNREAVNGEEYGGYNSFSLAVWPYTRGVVGPMDLTPRLNSKTNASNGCLLAMNIMFESGIPCMASSVEEYRESNAKALLMNLPAAWDDIHFIDGKITEYTMLARRSGNCWYAAAIANKAQSRMEMPLDFLNENTTYTAYIYRDGVGRANLINEVQTVTSEDVLNFNLLETGGYCAMFVPILSPSDDTPDEGKNDSTTDDDTEPKDNVTDEKENNGPSTVLFVVAAVAAVVIGGIAGFVFVRKKKE